MALTFLDSTEVQSIQMRLHGLLFVTFPSHSFAERTTTYLHHDLQGHVVAASDDQGVVVWRKTYFPCGKLTERSDRDESVSYTGHVADHDSKLIYMKARYYDQLVGRFTGRDPVAAIRASQINPMMFNRYTYANNNPFKFVDPTGTIPEGAKNANKASEKDA